MQKKLCKRILYGILFPLFIVIGCLCAASENLTLPCLFREQTGLYCAGCGSGRAIAAILQGKFLAAFRWNPLLYFLGIPSMLILIYEYIRIVFGLEYLKPIMLPQWLIHSTVIVLLGFWILRNIPLFSFLAPCG